MSTGKKGENVFDAVIGQPLGHRFLQFHLKVLLISKRIQKRDERPERGYARRDACRVVLEIASICPVWSKISCGLAVVDF
jgi:hypothetical protein